MCHWHFLSMQTRMLTNRTVVVTTQGNCISRLASRNNENRASKHQQNVRQTAYNGKPFQETARHKSLSKVKRSNISEPGAAAEIVDDHRMNDFSFSPSKKAAVAACVCALHRYTICSLYARYMLAATIHRTHPACWLWIRGHFFPPFPSAAGGEIILSPLLGTRLRSLRSRR